MPELPPHPSGGPADPDAVPPPLLVAAGLVAVQGVVLVGLAVAEAATTSADRLGVGLPTAVFFGVYGVLLLVSAAALWRLRGWARGPAVLTQLISLGLAWNLRDVPLVALVLAVSAVVALVGVLHPASMQALLGAEEPDEG